MWLHLDRLLATMRCVSHCGGFNCGSRCPPCPRCPHLHVNFFPSSLSKITDLILDSANGLCGGGAIVFFTTEIARFHSPHSVAADFPSFALLIAQRLLFQPVWLPLSVSTLNTISVHNVRYGASLMQLFHLSWGQNTCGTLYEAVKVNHRQTRRSTFPLNSLIASL